ncbi:Mitochondrial intermembrane space import and assembly protein 40 [Chamberlinius hualienensis]
MSYCKKEGKDEIVFVTKEDHEKPIEIELSKDDDESPGVILPNGEINWNCPCLGGMATGPCGVEFREAFSCFHYSKASPKGSDCYGQFDAMQQCMVKFPNLYPQPDDPLDIDEHEEDNKHAKPADLEAKSLGNTQS